MISPSNLNESLVWQSTLGCSFFPFLTLKILCHSLLACTVSVEKSADNLIRVPLYVICHFSFVAFHILSLSLIFVSDGKPSVCNAGDLGLIPGSGKSLEKGTATHSSILAWRSPWTEEPGAATVRGVP